MSGRPEIRAFIRALEAGSVELQQTGPGAWVTDCPLHWLRGVEGGTVSISADADGRAEVACRSEKCWAFAKEDPLWGHFPWAVRDVVIYQLTEAGCAPEEVSTTEWRAACPVCGGGNSLVVEQGEGALRLRCSRSSCPGRGDEEAYRKALEVKADRLHGIVRLADVEERPVDWLARHVIPFGTLTQLIGKGGTGKTSLAIHVGARLTRGEPLFPGFTAPAPASVLVLSAEDAIASVLTARFRIAGADMRRVHVLDLSERDATFPESTDWIGKAVEELGARLLILDPLSAFIGGRVDSHKDSSLRTMLRPIHALAERRSMAVLGILHVNQSQSTDVATKVSGSGAWTNAARSALIFGRMPEANDDDPRRVVIVRKSNYGPDGFGFDLALEVPPGEEHPRVRYLGPTTVEGTELLAELTGGETRRERSVAIQFLERVLADGERLSSDVYAEAEAEGLSARTLDRARKELEVEWRREGFGRGGKTYLRLPSRHAPPPLSRDEVADDGAVGENPHQQRDNADEAPHTPPFSSHVRTMADNGAGGVSDDDLERWQHLAGTDEEAMP